MVNLRNGPKYTAFFTQRHADRWTNAFAKVGTSCWTSTSRERERSSANIHRQSRSFFYPRHVVSCSGGWPAEELMARRQSIVEAEGAKTFRVKQWRVEPLDSATR